MKYEYRKYAIEILYKVNNQKGYSNILVNEYMEKLRNKQERNLLNITVSGVLENKIYLDWVINELSNTKFSKISKEILEILRIGIYQIEFLDNINPKTIVYESVEEAKKHKNKYLSKFVNGILRSYIRKSTELKKSIENFNKNNYLSIIYSFPIDFIERLKKEFNSNDIENILISMNSRPAFTARINTTLISRDELIEKLNEQNINSKKTEIAANGINILDSDMSSIKEVYKEGLLSIQGESSMIAVEVLNIKNNSYILDLCSAPGGKGLYATELMNNTGKVDCRDIYINKINTVKEQIERLKLKNVNTKVEDATIFKNEYIEKYDYCIVDVPCTNSGIIRRKPEIKYKSDFNQIETLKEKQLKILENAGKYLKVKGEMVYSTCSIFKEENIEIIENFLTQNSNFELVPLDKRYMQIDKNYKKGYLNIYTHVNNLDGFFIAKIRKIKIW